jgi:hypothetical protein
VQLDKTRIAIRERPPVDVLDLALRICRVYAMPLLAAFSLGIAPMMLFNGWLLAGYVELDLEFGFAGEYLFYMVLLVVLETPLATAPATLYLGKALFTERPQAGTVAREFLRALPRLLLHQGLLRIWHLRSSYLNELILLEHNVQRSRVKALHRGPEHDVAARWFGQAAVGGIMLGSLWCSIYLARVMLLSQWHWEFDRPMYTLYFPLALWAVVSYFTVVRFLSYLDLRIRREGWELELTMRAERDRLMRHSK